MTIAEAIECAKADFAGIRTGATFAMMGAMTEGDDWSAVLVDGSMFGPSWRAMAGGATVWDHLDGADDAGFDVSGAYTETLDRLTDDWSGQHGETLGWNEGCLFVYGPDFDHEAF